MFFDYIHSKINKEKLEKVVFLNYKFFLAVWVNIHFKFNRDFSVFSLGDYPIPFLSGQFVFFHQVNLLLVEGYFSKHYIWKVKRWLFNFVCKNSKGTFFVQTNFVRELILKNYISVKDNFELDLFSHAVTLPEFPRISRSKISKIELFYPSSFYPHKNHNILFELEDLCEEFDVTIYLTVSDSNFVNFKHLKFVRNLGIISREESLSFLFGSSGLFFPSLFESYGLPLIEARLLSKPIIAFDNEVNREVVPDALFFKNSSDLFSLLPKLNVPQNLHIKLNDFNDLLGKYF